MPSPLPRKILKSRSSEISRILGTKNHADFMKHLKISVVVVEFNLLFFINVIFIVINEIQTDGGKRSYRQW